MAKYTPVLVSKKQWQAIAISTTAYIKTTRNHLFTGRTFTAPVVYTVSNGIILYIVKAW